jgi:hypothetical protein
MGLPYPPWPHLSYIIFPSFIQGPRAPAAIAPNPTREGRRRPRRACGGPPWSSSYRAPCTPPPTGVGDETAHADLVRSHRRARLSPEDDLVSCRRQEDAQHGWREEDLRRAAGGGALAEGEDLRRVKKSIKVLIKQIVMVY